MPLAQAWGVVPAGVAGLMVRVEVDVAQGLPSVGVVGLAQASVAESRWRVRSAIVNSGLAWPNSRITIGLSPADLPKSGTGLDLPIAAAMLQATGQVIRTDGRVAFLGELGLDGTVKAVVGALAAAISARRAGVERLVVAAGNAREVRAVPGITPVAVRDLAHLAALINGQAEPDTEPDLPGAESTTVGDVDFSDVRGHEFPRFALEVAAAGGHHCSMIGPPGVGKTLLASRFPTILPDLTDDQALEVTAAHALAGVLLPGHGLLRRPPFVAPHHSVSAAAMLGTVRQGVLVPGAVTLANGGVLFLDEAPEFARPCLEGLRQPLEQGDLTVMRVGSTTTAPARFQLIIAANPCPCGQAIGLGTLCTCTPMAKRRYAERLSGPLMDRIDIRFTVSRPTDTGIRAGVHESSAAIAQRVLDAHQRARRRWQHTAWTRNAQVPGAVLRTTFAPTPKAVHLLEKSEDAGLNPRGSDRVLRLAWTLADLDGAALPDVKHVATALSLRGEGSAP